MSGWTWEVRATADQVVDLSAAMKGFDWSLSVAEVERLPLAEMRRPNGTVERRVVGDLFRVTRQSDDPQLVLLGTCERLSGIGHRWSSGQLTVDGSAGSAVAREQVAGTIRVLGSVGDGLAAGKRGGLVRVDGDAGASIGGPTIGRGPGMRGGAVWVRGNAGDRVGERLRRGTIVVEGHCGSECGLQMIAGTVLIAGTVGPHVGRLLRRGTLIARRDMVRPLAEPAWSPPQVVELLVLRLLWRAIASWNASLAWIREWPIQCERQIGDRTAGGIGEFLRT